MYLQLGTENSQIRKSNRWGVGRILVFNNVRCTLVRLVIVSFSLLLEDRKIVYWKKFEVLDNG